MKFAVVVGGIPNPTSGGGALTTWSVIRALVDAGHVVTVCLIENLHVSPSRTERNAKLDSLSELGVKIVSIDGAMQTSGSEKVLTRGCWLPADLMDYYPTAALTSAVRGALEPVSPHAIFAYHFEALAATYNARIAPLMAGVGDPTHLPGYYRWRTAPFWPITEFGKLTAGNMLSVWRMPRHMRTMMAACTASGAFAAHHAAWFRKIGVPHCQYLRTPVVDDAGPDWADKRRKFQKKSRFKVLLIGHLKGIATLSGLYLFAREVLPILERELGANKAEIHIVGGFSPPDGLRKLLDRPSVIMRGQIEPASEEFLSADVLVVPTPIRLGIRVRIITGFSFGCCIVAHNSNALGIPEMVDQKSALLAMNGRALAEAILTAFADPSLRERLGAEARRTYEECFAVSVAGRRIVDGMEEIARR